MSPAPTPAVTELGNLGTSGTGNTTSYAYAINSTGAAVINFSRAEIGFRGRNLEALQIRIADETNQVHGALSQEIDTDYAAAISSLTSRQAALEASLRLSAQLSQLTLLNFL